VRKTLLTFCAISVVVLAFWGILGGIKQEFIAFSAGLSIFTANLILWTIVVRELLGSAAHAAESIIQAEKSVESASEEPNPQPSETNHSVGILISGMVAKLVILVGGVYLCLAVLKLLPYYFVGGLIAGLGLFAVVGYLVKR
jgi:hypothetical protein